MLRRQWQQTERIIGGSVKPSDLVFALKWQIPGNYQVKGTRYNTFGLQGLGLVGYSKAKAAHDSQKYIRLEGICCINHGARPRCWQNPALSQSNLLILCLIHVSVWNRRNFTTK